MALGTRRISLYRSQIPLLSCSPKSGCETSSYGILNFHSLVLHCASLLRIISRVINARALKNGDFFFAVGPRSVGPILGVEQETIVGNVTASCQK